MKITMLGASGFVGRELSKYLESLNHEVVTLRRDDESPSDNCGTVIFSAGFGDCNKPLDVVDGNLTYLINRIKTLKYNRFIYFSSTRVYMCGTSSEEDCDLIIKNDDNRSLFNVTKIAAENVLKKFNDVVIVRPSNIFGPAFDSSLFLPSIVRDAISLGEINMYVSKEYEKDYIHINDICHLIEKIINKNTLDYNVYNLASGYNIKSSAIAGLISKLTSCKVDWHCTVSEDIFPVTSIKRIKSEFDFTPMEFEAALNDMVNEFKEGSN